MSWQTLTVGLLKVYGRGSPLNLNSLWEAYFLPSLVHVAYQDLQHTRHIFSHLAQSTKGHQCNGSSDILHNVQVILHR